MTERPPAIGCHPSPNHGPRRGGALPDMVVLHYTGMAEAASAIERLADPSAEVSAHYVVTEQGAIISMVPEERRAWHAGVARWGHVTDVNSRSIGIEIVNPGHAGGLPPFPECQMASLDWLLGGILARHAIVPERVVGHACIAPGRKQDPGPKFDWRRLALRGLAVWIDPQTKDTAHAPADATAFQRAAAAFGYDASRSRAWDPETRALWLAFRDRFLPGGAAEPNAAGVAHLERLAARWPVAAAHRP